METKTIQEMDKDALVRMGNDYLSYAEGNKSSELTTWELGDFLKSEYRVDLDDEGLDKLFDYITGFGGDELV